MTSVIIFKECIQIIEIVTNYSLEKCVSMSKWNRQGCIANNALQINLQTEKPKKVRTLMVKTRYKLWHVYDYTITY